MCRVGGGSLFYELSADPDASFVKHVTRNGYKSIVQWKIEHDTDTLRKESADYLLTGNCY